MKDRSNGHYRRKILEVIGYIDANLNHKLTLEEVANSIGMNKNSLSRSFKSGTDVNLNYYISEKKMKRAMELLHDESSTIKDVAMVINMDDQLYFNKVFKEYCNVSPNESRKKLYPGAEK